MAAAKTYAALPHVKIAVGLLASRRFVGKYMNRLFNLGINAYSKQHCISRKVSLESNLIETMAKNSSSFTGSPSSNGQCPTAHMLSYRISISSIHHYFSVGESTRARETADLELPISSQRYPSQLFEVKLHARSLLGLTQRRVN